MYDEVSAPVALPPGILAVVEVDQDEGTVQCEESALMPGERALLPSILRAIQLVTPA